MLILWFQFHSHQIFHCFVIAGAIVHYHGISIMAIYRLKIGECPLEAYDRECLLFHTHFVLSLLLTTLLKLKLCFGRWLA